MQGDKIAGGESRVAAATGAKIVRIKTPCHSRRRRCGRLNRYRESAQVGVARCKVGCHGFVSVHDNRGWIDCAAGIATPAREVVIELRRGEELNNSTRRVTTASRRWPCGSSPLAA